MHFQQLTNFEKESVLKYFGKEINELDIDTFKKIRNQLRMKYHPDKFEKLNDETALEMALEKFKEIDALCERIETFFNNRENILPDDQQIQKEDFLQKDARFAFKGMYIEIMTSDKDLKYHLFGTRYRFLTAGEKYYIKGTNAFIRIEEDYAGRKIGFSEAIKMYLSFEETDVLEIIVVWLYMRIQGRASSLIIENDKVNIDIDEILYYIKKKSFLLID